MFKHCILCSETNKCHSNNAREVLLYKSYKKKNAQSYLPYAFFFYFVIID